MKELLAQLFSSKGLQVPGRDYEELMESWKELQSKKAQLDQSFLNDCDIAIRYIPGDDHSDY